LIYHILIPSKSRHISFILIKLVVCLIQDLLILDQLWSTLMHTALCLQSSKTPGVVLDVKQEYRYNVSGEAVSKLINNFFKSKEKTVW